MSAALEGVDVVFHLASRAYGVGYSAGKHLAILDHNERITNNLVNVLARRPVEHLQVVSSSCVYPDDGPDTIGELPLYSGEPENANWGYGWSKRMLEQKALMLARQTGVPLSIVRPFNIYAERYNWVGDASQAIPMQVRKVMRGDDPVVIWGSGEQRRNYIHAFDCSAAMVSLVQRDFDGVVNIGTEETVTLRGLVETICQAAGRNPELVLDLSKPEGRRVKSCDASLLRRVAPDFHVSINLPEGVRRMIEWHEKTFADID